MPTGGSSGETSSAAPGGSRQKSLTHVLAIRAKADDRRTWVTRRRKPKRKSRQLVNGAGGGIGIELGDLGHDVFLAGLDLDTCVDKAGGLADWAAEILAAVPSYAETQPERNGH